MQSMRYLIVFLVVWDLASSCWKMKCWFFEILCIRNYTRQHMGTVRMLININSWFNKVNLCLAKLRSISWGHFTIRMTWTLSTISFLWDFRFLPNIWVNLGGTRIYCMRFTVNNFFVCEPWFIDLFDCLCAAVFWLLTFVTLLKISSLVKFLVIFVLNGLNSQIQIMSYNASSSKPWYSCCLQVSMGVWFILLAKYLLIYSCNFFSILANHFP